MAETITSVTDNEIGMNEMPVRNRESPDNNSTNGITNSDETTPMIANTSSAPPAGAATPPLSTDNGQQNNEPQSVDPNTYPNGTTSGLEWDVTSITMTFPPPPLPLPTDNNGQQSNESAFVKNRLPLLVGRRRFEGSSAAPITRPPSELHPSETPFSGWDNFMAKYSIGVYAWDVGTDLYLVGKHSFNHDWWYFGLTLMFVLLPPLVMAIIMRRWYDTWRYGGGTVDSIYAASNIYVRILITVTPLGPYYRYMEILDHGLKSREPTRSSEERLEHLTNLYYKKLEMSRLRLIDTFMESAPQLVLQLYILAKTSTQSPDIWTVLDWLSVLGSVVALSSTLVNYEVAPYMGMIRFKSPRAQQNYDNMKREEFVINVIWRLLTIMARVSAMALFASVFRFALGPICVVHWLIMFGCVIYITIHCKELIMHNQVVTNPCTKVEDLKCKQYKSAAYLAYVLLFDYHNSCRKLIGQQINYYTMMFIVNCALMIVWYINCPESLLYKVIALCAHFGCFFLGLIIMGVYYIHLDRRTLYVVRVANAPEPWWNILAHAKSIKRLLLARDERMTSVSRVDAISLSMATSGLDNSESSYIYLKLHLQPTGGELVAWAVHLPRNINFNGFNGDNFIDS